MEMEMSSNCTCTLCIGKEGGGGIIDLNSSCFNEEEEPPYASICNMKLDAINKVCSRGHWRPAEDSKLKELVALYGPQNWNLIADKLQGRSGKSCRLRWFNQLDPRINRRAFTEEEEERLMAAHRLYGNKWAMIARLFPGRTDNAVKNHWHVIIARKYREQSMTNRTIRKQQHFHDNVFTKTINTSSSSPSTSLAYFPAGAAGLPTTSDHHMAQSSAPSAAAEDQIYSSPPFIDFLGVGSNLR